MAVILDDMYEMWVDFSENLIQVEPFVYFIDNIDSTSAKTSGDNDILLLWMAELLNTIHTEFYINSRTDVKEILSSLRSQVLIGHTLVFSKVFALDRKPSNQLLWQVAGKFGANCTEKIPQSEYILIASDKRTEKAKNTLRRNLPVLHRAWLERSIIYWCKMPEKLFTLDFIENLDKDFITPRAVIGEKPGYNGVHSPQKKVKLQESSSESSESSVDGK